MNIRFSCIQTYYHNYDELFALLADKGDGWVPEEEGGPSIVKEDGNGKWMITAEQWEKWKANRLVLLYQLIQKRFQEGGFKEFGGKDVSVS